MNTYIFDNYEQHIKMFLIVFSIVFTIHCPKLTFRKTFRFESIYFCAEAKLTAKLTSKIHFIYIWENPTENWKKLLSVKLVLKARLLCLIVLLRSTTRVLVVKMIEGSRLARVQVIFKHTYRCQFEKTSKHLNILLCRYNSQNETQIYLFSQQKTLQI